MTARTAATNDLIKAGIIFVPMDFRAPAEEALGLTPDGKYHAFIDDVVMTYESTVRKQ